MFCKKIQIKFTLGFFRDIEPCVLQQSGEYMDITNTRPHPSNVIDARGLFKKNRQSAGLEPSRGSSSGDPVTAQVAKRRELLLAALTAIEQCVELTDTGGTQSG
jgi:hypothetical protein